MTAIGILVLAVCAALTVWYQLLEALTRQQDGPWLAFLVGGGILVGGVFLAIGAGG